MPNRQKCQLSVCDCNAADENPYCSDYCEQAASQGIPKDFCQCAHSECEQHHQKGEFDVAKLPESIRFTPGQVTIEYRSMDDLSEQIMLLMEAMDANCGPSKAGEVPRRRPAAFQPPDFTKAQTA